MRLPLFLVVGLCAPLCQAELPATWYTAIKASIGEVRIDDVTDNNTIGTGMVINGLVDGALRDEELDDYTAGLGIAVGRRVGRWAIEGEWVYRYRTDFDNAALTPSIGTVTNVFANVQTHSLLLNVIRRGVLSERWSWELGAGLGAVYNDVDADFIERARQVGGADFKVSDSNRSTDVAFNVLAGVVHDLRGPWALNVRYRYITLGDLTAGPFPTRAAVIDGEHRAHELQFSFERDFSGRY